ncbi:hypothetical protein XELAEV_18004005mg [Xenopus laevis]|uniref:Sushi domain-containing protein n=1 Tax=Xenopus laevis TaxID=8355 RepID=A0A974BRS2_XENLA|nr:hypothetical protein XELAEV_18004005mg [Xenopus laevis]
MSPSFLAPLILTVLGVQITCSNGNPETISEQCAKPTGPRINSLSPNKDFYDLWEFVTVTCAPGYQSLSQSIRCITHSNWNVPDPCIDQCLLSQINGINRTGVEQEYYDPFESVTVRCMEGYSATRETISCLRNAMFTAWSNSVPCTEQCKKSDLSRDPNVQLVPPQDYYPPNTEVSVRCPLGYKPSRDTITCKSAQDKNVWDVTVPFRCVGKYITFMG